MAAKRSAVATLVLALAGLAIAAMITHTHAQLEQGLAVACKVNETVDCAPVLSSEYAYLFGVPIAWLALVAYAGLAVAAVVAWRAPSALRRRQAASLLFAGAVAALVFSAYLAYVALVVIGHVCPQCTGLYVVNLLLVASTAWLYAATQSATRAQQAWRERVRLISGGALGMLALLLGAVAWKAVTNPGNLSPNEVCERDPMFCQQYKALPIAPVAIAGGHAKGRPDAPVTIVEFSDFECGHCKEAYRAIKAALPTYGNDVQVRFHHYPLDAACNPAIPAGGGHKYACLAATAAECAGAQDKFWQYHDALFEHQPDFTRDDLLRYADAIGLDRLQFTACLDSDAARTAIARDVAAGDRLGIESTPTLFLNGRTVRGALRGDVLGYAIVLERAAVAPRS